MKIACPAIKNYNIFKNKPSKQSKIIEENNFSENKKAFYDALCIQRKAQIFFGQNITNKLSELDEQKKQRELIISKLNGLGFEELLADIYRKSGKYDSVLLTRYRVDGGVDLILEKDGEKTIVEATLFDKASKRDEIAALDYCAKTFQTKNVIFVTVSGVCDEAYEYCEKLRSEQDYNFQILNLDDVVKLAFNSGVTLDETMLSKFGNVHNIDEKKDEIVGMYEAGFSLENIACEVGSSVVSIIAALKKWNIEKRQTIIEANKDKIIEMYQCGHSQDEIAKEIGCTQTGISFALKRWGVEKNPRMSQLMQDKIIQLYKENKSTHFIAKETGCSQSAVYNLLLKLGCIKQKTPKRKPLQEETIAQKNKAKIIQLAKKKISHEEIAKEIGCSRGTIDRAIRDLEAEIKDDNDGESILDKNKELIIEMYKNNVPRKEIALKIGCCERSINRKLKEWSIPDRRKNKKNNEQVSDIHKKWQCYSIDEFSKEASLIFNKSGFDILDENFKQGCFTLGKDDETILVRCVNKKTKPDITLLRACASYLDNNTEKIILVSSSGISKSAETRRIFDKYQDRLVCLNLDDIINISLMN